MPLQIVSTAELKWLYGLGVQHAGRSGSQPSGVGVPASASRPEEPVKNRVSSLVDVFEAVDGQVTLCKFARPCMSRVLELMEISFDEDSKALRDFLRKCG